MGQIVIGQTNKKIRLGKLPRALRNNMADAEQALWHLLRGRQIFGLAGACPLTQPWHTGRAKGQDMNDNPLPEAPPCGGSFNFAANIHFMITSSILSAWKTNW